MTMEHSRLCLQTRAWFVASSERRGREVISNKNKTKTLVRCGQAQINEEKSRNSIFRDWQRKADFAFKHKISYACVKRDSKHKPMTAREQQQLTRFA